MGKIEVKDLLRDAAKQLEGGYVFPSSEYIDTHDLTLTQSTFIAEKVASIIRGYLALPKELRAAFDMVPALIDEEGQELLRNTPQQITDKVWTTAFHHFFSRTLSDS